MNAVPAVSLHITAQDTERFLQASFAVDTSQNRPLHEVAYESASQQCQYTLQRLDLPLLERQTASLLFVSTDIDTKLQALLDAYGSTVDQNGLVSIFRSILTAVSCCTHNGIDYMVQVEGKPKSPERKRVKQEEFGAASFDSSLGTLRDEDEVRKELDEMCLYAAKEVLLYANNANVCDPETFFKWYHEQGRRVVPWLELLDLSNWKKYETSASSPNLMNEQEKSPTLISFDFSGSGSTLCIDISQDNLKALQHYVNRTNLASIPASEVCKALIQASTENSQGRHLLAEDKFRLALGKLCPNSILDQLPMTERNAFVSSMIDFFRIFAGEFGEEVDVQELAVGMCFFCAGNKSAKLACGFELLDEQRNGYLTEDQLLNYLRSYLLALVALSFLLPVYKYHERREISPERRQSIRSAVEAGAQWTLGHFVQYYDSDQEQKDHFTFESFANWYSTGGYNIAPWLELLDLKKVLKLLQEAAPSPLPLPPLGQTTERRATLLPQDRNSSLRRHHSSRRGPPPEVLFSFPLANRQSLVVLNDDARYVREVVEQLGLLSLMPDELWSKLNDIVSKKREPKEGEVAVYVNRTTFVESMEEICPCSRKRSSPGESPHSVVELLSNFYQCFDIDQVDSVALDELMGGLTLLCGGKKSMKLAFAFSIFDTRPGIHEEKDVVHSLSGEDLFLFLRSILIVTFSCCRQSLDMTDAIVGRCIADTANMICNDVMRHQWETKQMDRLNFDEFGHWYNEGGFERAPWLELLDLKKWVLVENLNLVEKQKPGSRPKMAPTPSNAPQSAGDLAVPPPPPEDALDPSFFDENGIMPMDSMDEVDMMLMPQPSTDRDLDGDGLKISKSFSFSSPRNNGRNSDTYATTKAETLNFMLNTAEDHGGYSLSISQPRIQHLRRILEDSGLNGHPVEHMCNTILSKASKTLHAEAERKLSKDGFDKAMENLISWRRKTDPSSKKALKTILDGIFYMFDRENRGRPNAAEVACGMTVLCAGKKSDKLEFAFELLDNTKRGRLNKEGMTKYLRSFLTVLLGITFSPVLTNDPEADSIHQLNGQPLEECQDVTRQAVLGGSSWAVTLAFSEVEGRSKGMSFDDFAAWYTEKGFQSVPWLELIDLRKWIMT